MAKILIIEDDEELCHSVRDWLSRDKHAVEYVNTAREGLERMQHYVYDIVILDLSLPDGDGIDLLHQYRRSSGSTPVLLLTGRNTMEDKEQGLDTGADDYLCKPFDPRELSARVRALTRRSPVMTQTELRLGDLVLEPANCRVTKAGMEVNLLAREYSLLEFLMRHPGQTFSSEVIMDRVWSSDSDTSPDVVRVHMARLRSKIDEKGQPSWITTKRGLGYKLELPPQTQPEKSSD